MTERLDWTETARRYGCLEGYSSEAAQRAISEWAARYLVEHHGEQVFVEAVWFYLGDAPGCDLVRMVLKALRPPAARRECLSVLDHGEGDTRVSAAELLSCIVTRAELGRLAALLHDSDANVRFWAARAVEHLAVLREIHGGELGSMLSIISVDQDEQVRSMAEEIRRALREAGLP